LNLIFDWLYIQNLQVEARNLQNTATFLLCYALGKFMQQLPLPCLFYTRWGSAEDEAIADSQILNGLNGICHKKLLFQTAKVKAGMQMRYFVKPGDNVTKG